jgi:membrane-bound lytic murein transglycosylase D
MVGLELLTLLITLAQPSALLAQDSVPAFCHGECASVTGLSHLVPTVLTTRRTQAVLQTGGLPELHPDLSSIQIPVTLNTAVRDTIRSLTTGRGRYIFAGWYARMGLYEDMMLPILARHGMPSELLYICMIESGFSPDAVSRAGAVGPWQFMKSTGLAYGLRHDDWVDERRDPIKSTDAAARYFKKLHRRFGSWPLAFAAYNAGPGAILGPMRRNGTNDFWRLTALGAIPSGASRYAIKAMAVTIIGRNAKLYGFGPVRKKAPIQQTLQAVPGGMEISAIAKSIGLAKKRLNALNPELRRGYTPPYGSEYALKVPPEKVDLLRTKLVGYERRKPIVFSPYRLKFGERISDVARRYSMTRSALAHYNDLPSGEPDAGTEILVPRRTPKANPSPVMAVLQDPGLDFDYPDRILVYFPIRRYLSLNEISAFFKVSPGSIAMWNGLDPAVPLQRGMVLRLYLSKDFDRLTALLIPASQTTPVHAGTPGAQAALLFARSGRSKNRRIKIHTIRRGDNLWTLSRKYGVTRESIQAVNGGKRKMRLKIGRKIRIPVNFSPKPRGKAAKKRPKPEMRGKRYVVRSGDSLWKIARRFGIKVNALKRKNRIRKGRGLRPGQVIMIPR